MCYNRYNINHVLDRQRAEGALEQKENDKMIGSMLSFDFYFILVTGRWQEMQ